MEFAGHGLKILVLSRDFEDTLETTVRDVSIILYTFLCEVYECSYNKM